MLTLGARATQSTLHNPLNPLSTRASGFRDERLSDAIAHFQKNSIRQSKPKPQQLIGRCFRRWLVFTGHGYIGKQLLSPPVPQTLFWLVCAAIHAGDDAAAMRYHRQPMQTAIDTPGITELGHDVHQRQLHQSYPNCWALLSAGAINPPFNCLATGGLITQQRNYTNLNFSNHHNDTGISQSLHHNIRDAVEVLS